MEKAIADLEPRHLGHINYEGVRYNALPLYGTLGQVWLLRTDGTFWMADSDFGLELQPLPEKAHVSALVYGAERYPFLRPLIPIRPADAASCTACAAEGLVVLESVIPAGAKTACCECHGLGWLSSGR